MTVYSLIKASGPQPQHGCKLEFSEDMDREFELSEKLVLII